MAAPREHAVPIHVPARPGNHTTPDEIAEDSGSSWPRSWKTASECYSGSASRRSSGSFMDRVGQLRQRSAASPAQRPGSLDIRAEAPSTSQLYTPFQSPDLASQDEPEGPPPPWPAPQGVTGSSALRKGNSSSPAQPAVSHRASDGVADLDSLREPLLGQQQQQQQQSHARGSFDEERHSQLQDCQVVVERSRGTASFAATAFNTINILAGVGMLATPYALASSGLAALLLLPLLGAAACYTGNLIGACLQAAGSGASTYPDIGHRALGHTGRVLVSVLLYFELFSCCVEFLILDGDNLAAIFPQAELRLGAGFVLPAQKTMMLLAAAVVLPTVLLRDMSALSYVSVGGITSSVALVALVAWEGVAVTGFQHASMPLIQWDGVPLALGLYSFCYSGHAVFPSLYSSMAQPQRWSRLLALCFAIAVLLYAGMALLGAAMFGPGTADNVTLNMQQAAPTALPTVLAMWLVIVSPLTKIGLTLAPVAMALEELLPQPPGTWAFTAASLALRTSILAATLAVALTVPFFAAVMSFIGAFLSMAVAIVLPCVFYVAIFWRRLGAAQMVLPVAVGLLGVAAGAAATYESVKQVIGKY